MPEWITLDEIDGVVTVSSSKGFSQHEAKTFRANGFHLTVKGCFRSNDLNAAACARAMYLGWKY